MPIRSTDNSRLLRLKTLLRPCRGLHSGAHRKYVTGTRLTSYIQEAQKGAQCHGRTHTTVCSACTGHAYGTNDSTDSIPQRQILQPDEVGPNIGLLAEELQGQWHGRLNGHLGNIVIKPYSPRKDARVGLSFLLGHRSMPA
ncbi:hypothetical protein WJX77_012195 [Trebouxia sp. C0004]